MTILETLNKLPADKWQLQVLHHCFVRGDVKKDRANITFETTRELGLQMNAACVIGRVEKIGLIIWVDGDAWEQAKSETAALAAAPAVAHDVQQTAQPSGDNTADEPRR